MRESALESVRIFQKSGIGLDYYKSKDFMSRGGRKSNYIGGADSHHAEARGNHIC